MKKMMIQQSQASCAVKVVCRLGENYRTVVDYQKQKKKLDDAVEERDTYKTQLDTANETLEKFKDIDPDNFLVYSLTDDELNGIAKKLYDTVKTITYTPVSLNSLISIFPITLGGKLSFTTHTGENVTSYVLKDTLSGVQLTSQTVIANGNETRNSGTSVSDTLGLLEARTNAIAEQIYKKITADSAEIKILTGNLANYKTVVAEKIQAVSGEFVSLNARQAEFEKLTADEFYAQNAKISEIQGDFTSFKNGEFEELKSNIITSSYLETNYAKIDLANIKQGCITTAMLGTGIVGTAQIADGSITDAKIVGLTANKITAGRLDAAEIEVVNLNAANITVGTINGQQIASGAIDLSKLSTELSTTITNTEEDVAQALKDAGLAQATANTAKSTADSAASTANTAKSIADSATSTANTAKSTADTANTNASTALTTANAAKSAAATAQTTADSAQTAAATAQTTADGKNTVFYQTAAPSTSGRKTNDVWFDTDDANRMYYWNGSAWTEKQFGTNAIADLSITNALIADGTIQNAKIANLDAGKITTGTLDAARIEAGTVTADKIASLAVTTAKLAVGAVNADKLAANSVIAGKIAANAVTAGTIAASAVTTDKLAVSAVTADKIASRTITADKIVANAITSNEIAAGSITANEIAANTITANELSANCVTAEKLEANSVTAEKIVSGAIKANKIDIGDLFAQRITTTGAVMMNDVTIAEFFEQIVQMNSKIEKSIDGIIIDVSSLSTKKDLSNNSSIQTYDVSEVPTLDNYPTITDFFIWDVCSDTLYCSDTLLCGTNDYEAHLGQIAYNEGNGTYYVFEKNTEGIYGWRPMSSTEVSVLADKYASVSVQEGEVSITAGYESEKCEVRVTSDGMRATTMYCC